MNIYLGADHRGYAAKEKIKKDLLRSGYDVQDMGNAKKDLNDDYTDFAYAVAQHVARKRNALGLLFCGSGEGMAIVANKVQGIRAATGFSLTHVKDIRAKNNANILALSTDTCSVRKIRDMINVFLRTPFSNAQRHVRRIEKIRRIERRERHAT